MTTTLQATFDGKVFVPDEPVDLAAGDVVQIQVCKTTPAQKHAMQLLAEKWEKEPSKRPTLGEFLEQFPDDPNSPTDGAAQHDHYLYGTPKRENP